MQNYWKRVPNARTAALLHFTPQMFTICMGTGILAVLMHNNPYQFRGLTMISTILFLLDLILFLLIASTFLLRIALHPKSTIHLFQTDIEQTTYLSTTSIALATLIELIALIPGSTFPKFQYFSFALWWFAVVWCLISTITTYWLLIRDEQVSFEGLSPTLMYPTTGVLATASAGSVVVGYESLSDNLRMPVVIVSYLLLGAGFYLSILTLASYFLRLLHNQTPPAKKIGAQFIPVAPFSNAAYAFITLGYIAGPKMHVFEVSGKGPIANAAIGEAIYASGFMTGLTLWGFATFWLILSTVALIRDLPKTHFNINHWSSAYPIGIYGVAVTQLAIDMDSTAFKVVSSMILVVAVVNWLYLFTMTVPRVMLGTWFLEKELEGMEKERRGRGSEDEETSVGV